MLASIIQPVPFFAWLTGMNKFHFQKAISILRHYHSEPIPPCHFLYMTLVSLKLN
uniref:Uncharacterized protein n=1 Tax=Arundo donax TaxID=35708 RepID=A0A0A9C264_ARUDO